MTRPRAVIARLLGGPLQPVLIACFALVAALTVGLSAAVTLRVITDYLNQAMSARVARDMDLAEAFYQDKLDEITAVSQQLAQDYRVVHSLPAAAYGAGEPLEVIEQEIDRKIALPTLDSSHLIAIFDGQGQIVAAKAQLPVGTTSPLINSGNWAALPILADALASGEAQAATEVIPADLLAEVGLAAQAFVTLIDTPKAAAEPFDLREGTAGLALTSVYPLRNDNGEVIGAALAAYLFNNDFSLVDQIKAVAGVDTVTVFFGDLRVSTNVMTEENTRAVGTRISQDVFDVVLAEGRDYVGRAFVVNDWYITRYEPLRNHLGRVIGSLYVGALESRYRALVQAFSQQVAIIAVVSIVLAGVVAVPIARLITRPIAQLVEANRRLAEGEMTVRVEPHGSGEIAVLGHSFNKMVETLDNTQQELLHKERLASMGQLAAGVAHEINNPLGTILLFSEAMYRDTANGGSQRDDLKMIIDQTLRCKTIVADLLNFARQQEVLAQETDIHALLDKVVGLVEHQPMFAKVDIIRQYEPELPAIQADPAQLEQVFVNLLNNAAESMADGGIITLRTHTVDQQWIVIDVSDTGCGIPAENIGKLFTPFFTTKALGKGTGLGLSIVYGIIKMHKGQIAVQSQVGQGTSFSVRLPKHLFKEESALIGEPGEAVA